MSDGVDHIQDSGIGKANRGPAIFSVVLAPVIGFNPLGVIKNKLGILEGNAVFFQVSCRFVGVPFKFHCDFIVVSFCSYVKSFLAFGLLNQTGRWPAADGSQSQGDTHLNRVLNYCLWHVLDCCLWRVLDCCLWRVVFMLRLALKKCQPTVNGIAK